MRSVRIGDPSGGEFFSRRSAAIWSIPCSIVTLTSSLVNPGSSASTYTLSSSSRALAGYATTPSIGVHTESPSGIGDGERRADVRGK